MSSKIDLSRFSQEERKVCENCSAVGFKTEKNGLHAICTPAELEAKLGRLPSEEDYKEDRINMRQVPELCPNGFVSHGSREIR
jgi:hypothetical protein